MKERKIFSRAIFNSLSPNTERDDLFLAFKLLFLPFYWKKGKAIKELEEKFQEYLKIGWAISFNSGRSAFLSILKALELKEGDEVLLQAFTCNAAVNPILALKLKPVFVDIEKETLNIDPKDLLEKISSRSKVVLIQHTFGLPAKIEEILKICEKYNLILIEDCAHSLGARYKGKMIGTFGRASFFSFGRDKIISSVFGGMAVTNDFLLAKKIRKIQEEIDFPSLYWIFQQILHPILVELIIKPLYQIDEVGRYLLLALQKIGILSKGVTNKEKRGKLPKCFPKKMPNALAILALNQLKKLEKFNQHRNRLALIYRQELQNLKLSFQEEKEGRTYMRFPIILKENSSQEILNKFRKEKIFLDDGWRKTPVVPPDTDQGKMGYQAGSCKNAEFVAKNILNLPCSISLGTEEAFKISKLLKKFLSS